jgi:hypothetical protein
MSENDENAESSDHERVLRAIERHVRENHQVCGVGDVEAATGLSRGRCEDILQHLLGNELESVYGKSWGRGTLRLYIPKYMWDSVLRSEKKPEWVDSEYSFEGEVKTQRSIQNHIEQLNEFARFKRLLYGIGTALEEAVAYSLDYLGFEGVEHLGGDDEHDVEFTMDDQKFIVEVGGSSSLIRKDKPKDLVEWMKKASLQEENKDFSLNGILIVNPHNETTPAERGQVLSNPAKKVMQTFHYKMLTTYALFELVHGVYQGDMGKEEARSKLLRGVKNR